MTVINGAVVTGYAVLDSVDWGNAVWQHAYSGPRGTQGARPAAGTPDNREVRIPIRIGPSGTIDACNLKAALLVEAVEDLRRFGGKIQFQATGQTPRQYADVMGCGITRETWGRKGANADVAECTIAAVCAPMLLGDPMDTNDAFETNTIADYTLDPGGSGTLSVVSGLLVPSSTGLKRYRHTAKGYVLGDAQATLKVRTGTTLTNGIWGATVRADTTGGDNLVVGQIEGVSNLIRVGWYIGGSIASSSTTAFTVAANTTYWVRVRVEGNVAFAEVFTAPPTSIVTPAASVQMVIPAAAASRLLVGHAGMRIVVADTAERYGPFTVEPYTYRGASTSFGPEQVRLGGAFPGDVPALVDATITPKSSPPGPPIWGLVGWLERPLIANLCWNGDLESDVIGATPWTSGVITGVIGACTPLRITTAARVKYGLTALQITTAATTDTGSAFLIPGRFKRGRTYAALCWASAASATTSSRIKLGVNTDIATGTAANLSTTPKVYSVVWTPTGDRDGAYVAFGINAATATVMAIDGIVVVESPTIALSAAIASAGATSCTVWNTPSDTPNLQADGTISAPFLVMIDQEIIRVTAIVGGAWTIERGAEGSTAATHALDAPVIVLPPLRAHLEGKGSFPGFGFVEAEAYVPTLSDDGAGVFAITADATARCGSVLRWTPGTSGSQLATLIYFIDPSLLVPDDYTLGEIDVEVWTREAWTPTLTGMRVTLSAQPEGGSAFGPERFTREFGNAGKLIQPATAKVSRIHRLGSVPMIVDRANPQRWRLKVALACTGGAAPTWDLDYFMLLASRARLASPTGEINDTAVASGAFPAFVPYDAAWGSSSGMSKTIRSDGSSLIAAPGGYAFPDQGFGDVLEMPDGDCDLIAKCSPLVPDDPTLDATDETLFSYLTDTHLAVTPRYVLMRSA